MVATSYGGHWVQMRRILPAFDGEDVFYVGTTPEPDSDMAGARYYGLPDVTRRNPHVMLPVIWRLVQVVRRERPDVIVTTGAAPGLLALAVGKLFGCRTIWIDSIANARKLSLSGWLARPVADAWLVQWEHLARPGGPHYWGAVL